MLSVCTILLFFSDFSFIPILLTIDNSLIDLSLIIIFFVVNSFRFLFILE